MDGPHPSSVASARTMLFVPASRPERLARALDSGAGCVILDLEDAVAPTDKAAARGQLAERLHGFTAAQLARTLVRINAVGTRWHEEDLRLVASWCSRGLAGAMVPKAESGATLDAISAALGPSAQIVPLIESLAGLDAVNVLARVSHVARLAFGHLDFQLDLGMKCGADEAELASVRFALVAASRRAQLPAPIDGVTVDIADGERLRQDGRRARASGFGAKLCIHPAQVAGVNDVFAPSAAEIAWARRVMEVARTSGGQAASLDGRMVDVPVIRLAEHTLRQVESVPATVRAT